MEKFDDIFRENVKKAFSNYNVDHLADEGWNSFMEQKKVGKDLLPGYHFGQKPPPLCC